MCISRAARHIISEARFYLPIVNILTPTFFLFSFYILFNVSRLKHTHQIVDYLLNRAMPSAGRSLPGTISPEFG